MESWANMAVFVNLVREILALRHRETLPRKKLRTAREQANAADPVFIRFGHQCFHQESAASLALRPRSHGDGANFCQMCAIQMQRAAAENAAIQFEHHEVSDVLADLRQRARQQRAVAGISRY